MYIKIKIKEGEDTKKVAKRIEVKHNLMVGIITGALVMTHSYLYLDQSLFIQVSIFIINLFIIIAVSIFCRAEVEIVE